MQVISPFLLLLALSGASVNIHPRADLFHRIFKPASLQEDFDGSDI